MRTKLFSFFPSMLALCLLFGTVNVYAGPPTGPTAMQVMGGSAVTNGAKLTVLESKVQDLERLRHANDKRNAGKIARLQREVNHLKYSACAKKSGEDYRYCLDKQDELERQHIKVFSDLMSGCNDEPGQVSTDTGLTVGGKRNCPDGRGILNNPANRQGNLSLLVVRDARGNVITQQTWSGGASQPSARSMPSSSVTQSALNGGWSPWERFGIAAASCGAAGLGGAGLGYKIADHADPDTDLFKGGKLVGVDHGSGDLGKWIGAAAGCVVGGATALIVTDDD